MENHLLTVVESSGFTLSPKGVLATFAFPVFFISCPRGSSLGFLHMGGGEGRGCVVNVPRGIAVCAGAIASQKGLLQEGRLLWGSPLGGGGFSAGALKRPSGAQH